MLLGKKKNINTELSFQALMAEYSELRQELRSMLQHQFTIISIAVSILGVLFVLGLNIYSSEFFKVDMFPVICFIFHIIVPGASSFLGIMWLDTVYRQVELGTYTALLGERVRTLLSNPELMNWEQWLQSQTQKKVDGKIQKKSLLEKSTYYKYYICIGLFVVLPIASAIFGLFLIDFQCCVALPYLVIAFLVYSLFILFTCVYVLRIIKHSATIDNVIPKTKCQDLK